MTDQPPLSLNARSAGPAGMTRTLALFSGFGFRRRIYRGLLPCHPASSIASLSPGRSTKLRPLVNQRPVRL
jgi:hypothetical protein